MTTTAQLIGNLLAEIAELKRELENERTRDIHSCGPDCQRAGCVNRRLRAENEALRKDAERYRHARKQIDVDITVMEIDEDGDEVFVRSYPPGELDAYLDNAMKGQ